MVDMIFNGARLLIVGPSEALRAQNIENFDVVLFVDPEQGVCLVKNRWGSTTNWPDLKRGLSPDSSKIS